MTQQRFRRVGRYGPRCSRHFKDRYAEMLAEDYRPTTLPFGFWKQWRDDELRWMEGDTPIQRWMRSFDATQD